MFRLFVLPENCKTKFRDTKICPGIIRKVVARGLANTKLTVRSVARTRVRPLPIAYIHGVAAECARVFRQQFILLMLRTNQWETRFLVDRLCER